MRVLVLLAVVCALGVFGSSDEDRKFQCFRPESFVKCGVSLSSKPLCASGVAPAFNFTTCCLTCLPAPVGNVTCPDVTARPCDLKRLKSIADINSVLLDNHFCPACNLRHAIRDLSKLEPEDSCEMLKVPKCRTDEMPSIVNGCPTCRPAVVCQRPAAAAAAVCTNIGICDTGVYPALDPATCCPTCKLNASAIAAALTCARGDKVSACVNSLDAKPQCATGAAPVYSTSTCCVDCVPPLPARLDEHHKCSDNEVRTCLLKVPACEDDQVPIAKNKSCCKLCKRPEWKCSPSEVAACLDSAPVCAAGEKPQRLDGACCRSCKPPPPTCTPACGDGSLCVPNGESGTARCKSAAELRLKLTVSRDLVQTLRAFSQDAVKAYLLEVFQRYCDVPENQEQCDAVRDDLKALKIKLLKFDAVAVSLVLSLTGAGSVSTAAHALHTFAASSSPDSGVVLQAALSSSVAQEGDTASVTVGTFSDNAAVLAASPHLNWLFATLLLAALLALF